jgi:hypothetical protein
MYVKKERRSGESAINDEYKYNEFKYLLRKTRVGERS